MIGDKCDFPACRGGTWPKDTLLIVNDNKGRENLYHLSCFLKLREILWFMKLPCGQKLRWRKSLPRLKYYRRRHIQRHGCEAPIPPELKAWAEKIAESISKLSRGGVNG